MALYSTGDIARACDVTVRTVQYYDAQGLLKPSELSEGGRRLYSEEDRERLQLICLLRSLGVSVASIGQLLAEERSEPALTALLDEQERQVRARIKDDERLLGVIAEVRATLEREGHVPRQSRDGIEHDIEGKLRLRRMYRTLLVVGIACDVVEWGTFIYALCTGNWVPFLVGMPFALAASALLVRMYYREAAYLCPACQTKFRPRLLDFIFARHTMTMRRLTCTNCGERGFCVETYADLSAPVE